jgi:ParB-like chromosome segregation protein Spo0J
MTKPVQMAFQPQGLILPVSNILPLKQIKTSIRSTEKYHQVLASVREVGIIEPLIVYPQNEKIYHLLDGHIRLEVLKQIGETHARCLISTDDETYT